MKRNLWPYGILLTFVLFISGTVGLIVMAATQKCDLVSADYYEHEVKYQGHLDSLERANHLPRPAQLSYDSANNRLRVTLPPDHAGRARGTVELYRPSAAVLDQSTPLAPDGAGEQFIDTTRLQPGLWKVRLTWTVNGEEFCLEQKLVVPKKS